MRPRCGRFVPARHAPFPDAAPAVARPVRPQRGTGGIPWDTVGGWVPNGRAGQSVDVSVAALSAVSAVDSAVVPPGCALPSSLQKWGPEIAG